jgi:hypothetical protein
MRLKIAHCYWEDEKGATAQPAELAVILPSKLAKWKVLGKDSR